MKVETDKSGKLPDLEWLAPTSTRDLVLSHMADGKVWTSARLSAAIGVGQRSIGYALAEALRRGEIEKGRTRIGENMICAYRLKSGRK